MKPGADLFRALSEARLSRRRLFQGALASAVPILAPGLGAATRRPAFTPLAPSTDDEIYVPDGYRADVVLSWGDPLFRDSAPFDPAAQSAERQRTQFGFNCDFNAFLPLTPGDRSRGLLATNHEYTRGQEMFEGYDVEAPTDAQVATQAAAHGMSVVELARDGEGRWRPVVGSRFNRRITAETPMRLSGPAAGTRLVSTAADREGREVLGMLGNCGGGKTPWGTVLTGEERTDSYFSNAAGIEDPMHAAAAKRYSMPEEHALHRWTNYDERFDLGRHATEPNRFCWVVEIDPYDPESKPVKRTALGRFMHEGATVALSDDGRAVVYSGDDDEFEYVYKFVSEAAWNPRDRAANRDLLDRGTLYVAKFHNDGTGEWLPLVPRGALRDWSQAQILVHARLAADVLGATPMDRPEDIEVNPLNHRVYVALTNNKLREEGDGGPNPRAKNVHGQVLELDEAGGDLAATRFAWTLFLRCEAPTISCPDNVAFDRTGNLWVATDGQPSTLKFNDSVYVVPTAGPDRGAPQRFMTGPKGAEITGPELTSDDRTFFASIQHPGEFGGLETPSSHWPSGEGIPRPSVIAVQREDGGPLT